MIVTHDIWLVASDDNWQFSHDAIVMAIGTCRIPVIRMDGKKPFGKNHSFFKKIQTGRRTIQESVC